MFKLKRICSFLILLLLLLASCSNDSSTTSGDSSTQTDPLDPVISTGQVLVPSVKEIIWDGTGKIDAGLKVYGGASVVNAIASQANGRSEIKNDFFYISGKNQDNQIVLTEIEVPSTGRSIVRYVKFGTSYCPPAPYPNSFEMNGTRYLLFGQRQGAFNLYKYSSTDAEYNNVIYEEDTLWDYSAISSYVSSIMYKGQNQAWITCPIFNVTRQTMYFTLNWWVENSIRGDYLIIRVFESKLVDNVFSTPTEIKGEINPYNPIHYINPSSLGSTIDVNDFLGGGGVFWIGRLYMTQDGTKAYLNVMNISYRPEIMKSDSPYLAPLPNSQNNDPNSPANICSYSISADVDTDGSFNNVKILTSSINRPGINFVSDISANGSKLIVAHMEIDMDFFTTWGYLNGKPNDWWGPDGIVMSLTRTEPWNIAPWDGTFEVFKKGDDEEFYVSESNAYLASLSIDSITLDKTFDKDTENYSATVDFANEYAVFNAETSDEFSKIDYYLNGDSVGSTIELKPGSTNEIKIIVTAPDALTMKTYQVLITRNYPENLCQGQNAARTITSSYWGTDFKTWLQGSTGYAYLAEADGWGGGATTCVGNVTKDPVIFLHDSSNIASGFNDIKSYFINNKGYNDCELYAITWTKDDTEASEAKIHHHGKQAAIIRDFINAVVEYTGKEKVDIIGWSMGVTMGMKAIQGEVGYTNSDRIAADACYLGENLKAKVDTFVGVAGGPRGLNYCADVTHSGTAFCGENGLKINSKFLKEINGINSQGYHPIPIASFAYSIFSLDDGVFCGGSTGFDCIVNSYHSSIIPGLEGYSIEHDVNNTLYPGLDHWVLFSDDSVRDKMYNMIYNHSM